MVDEEMEKIMWKKLKDNLEVKDDKEIDGNQA
jgi:hypothetical protein